MPEQNAANADDRPLVSLTEAAAATGRHPEALRGMLRRGRLTGVRGNDRKWLVRLPADLVARVCGAWAHGKIHVMYQWLRNR
jgi:hypothetical protein